MKSPFRDALPTLGHALTLRLAPHGFRTVEPDEGGRSIGITLALHRKTWNTNRGVLLVAIPALAPSTIGAQVQVLRSEGERLLGSSWWSQLGLQLVFEVESSALPSAGHLSSLVDAVNTQGVLVQSIFAIHGPSGARVEARTWGQMITGKFQDAIALALEDAAPAARETR
jgi:hypothetical protein